MQNIQNMINKKAPKLLKEIEVQTCQEILQWDKVFKVNINKLLPNQTKNLNKCLKEVGSYHRQVTILLIYKMNS